MRGGGDNARYLFRPQSSPPLHGRRQAAKSLVIEVSRMFAAVTAKRHPGLQFNEIA